MSLDFSFPIDDRWLPKSVLCLRDYNLNKFTRDEFEEVVGRENICANVNEALQRAEAVFERIQTKAATAK